MALRLACARMGGAQAHALHSVRLMSVHNSKKLAQMRGSPTYIVDPFVPPPRANKPGLLSLDYWRNLQRTASSTVRSGLVRGRIQRAIKDFVPSTFSVTAEKMLRDMQDAYAVGDPSAMRGVVVEEVLTTLKRGMRSRDSRAPERYAARIISFEEPASIVQYRQLPMSSTQVDMFHAQITVRMVPRYAVGIYSRHGDYLRDMTDLPEDLDLRSILPLLERSEAVPWRAARTSPLADPYFYRIDTQETTWTAPSIYIDQPSLYSGIGMAPPAQAPAPAPAPAGEDPLGLAKAAPPKAAPLSLVRELFAVFDRPAFNSGDGWRIMLLYSAPSDGSPMPRYTSVTAAAGLADPKA